MAIEDIHSLETEKHCIAGLFHNPTILPEIDFFVKETDFYQKVHQTIFLVLRSMILASERYDAVLLANKIAQIAPKHGDLTMFEYIELICYAKPTKEATIQAYKELLSYRIRRVGIEKLREMARLLQKPGEKKITEVIAKLDETYLNWSTEVLRGDATEIELCEGIEPLIEGTRNNPPKPENLLLGPFPTINRIIGSLSKPTNFTVVGARSGSCKSSLALFYQAYLAEKFSLPVVHFDVGELHPTDIRFRLACMFTESRVPMYALEDGTWANNEEWTKITRAAIQRAKKIKIYYEQVAGLSYMDVIKILRRYSYKFGRDKMFLPCFDYLKPMESGDGRETAEWQEMGRFIQNIKSFITSEVQLPFWTSLQLNRSGIVTNKKQDEIQDHEGTFGISDRILQQSSHSILLRYKSTTEMEEEGGNFGNMKMHFLKTRSLGRDQVLANQPVKLPSGKYVRNHFNIGHDSFFFREYGDLNFMVATLKNKYSLNGDKSKNLENESLL